MEHVNARWMSSLHGFLHDIEWIMFHGHLDHLKKRPLGGRPNTKLGDHSTLNIHNHWFYFIMVWGPTTWIEIHCNSIQLRDRSHMTSHYFWRFVTTLHDFKGVLGQPLDTFFWALTMSWSQLLACVWSGPKPRKPKARKLTSKNVRELGARNLRAREKREPRARASNWKWKKANERVVAHGMYSDKLVHPREEDSKWH
jgi:hypothetical protein